MHNIGVSALCKRIQNLKYTADVIFVLFFYAILQISHVHNYAQLYQTHKISLNQFVLYNAVSFAWKGGKLHLLIMMKHQKLDSRIKLTVVHVCLFICFGFFCLISVEMSCKLLVFLVSLLQI